MREIVFNLKENPFINFQVSRYSMTAELMWKRCGNIQKKITAHFLYCL